MDWDDGQRRVYVVGDLRSHCPCATCRAASFSPRVGTEPPSGEAQLTIQSMDAVGHYAYRILFSDGHDTGIYTLDLLRKLGRRS